MKIGYHIQIDGTGFSGGFELENGVSQKSFVSTHAPSQVNVHMDVTGDGHGCGRLSLEAVNMGDGPHDIGGIFHTLDIPALVSLDTFTSDWGTEFEPYQTPASDFHQIEVLSGRSSKGFAPWIGCQRRDGYLSLALAWSGNWTIRQAGPGQLWAGMDTAYFNTSLAPGDTLRLFDIYFSEADTREHSAAGLRQYFFDTGALIKKAGWTTLPVTYNTWWCFEDKFLNEDICLEHAKLCETAGITNFMLDAGWFGGNRKDISWFEKRGDWEDINTLDFPGGMACLGSKITGKGLNFGIWCEIEAIGEFAKLADIHPEFLARRDGQRRGYLCMADPRVRVWAMGHISRLIDDYHASWIKFDFNLDPGYGCNASGHGHGSSDGLYRHYEGYYALLDEIHRKYPSVVLENCSSGGLRMDLGILRHTHFTFLSDPDYVEHHFQCFWGATSFIHPACCYHFTQSECLGDHNGVQQPIYEGMPLLEFDYIIRSGMLCQIGFSYNLLKWPKALLERLAHHVRFYKEISGKYILNGRMTRLCRQARRHGLGDRWQIYQYSAADGSSLLFIFRLPGAPETTVIRLEGIQGEKHYLIENADTGRTESMAGHEILEQGIRPPALPEAASTILFIRETDV